MAPIFFCTLRPHRYQRRFSAPCNVVSHQATKSSHTTPALHAPHYSSSSDVTSRPPMRECSHRAFIILDKSRLLLHDMQPVQRLSCRNQLRSSSSEPYSRNLVVTSIPNMVYSSNLSSFILNARVFIFLAAPSLLRLRK